MFQVQLRQWWGNWIIPPLFIRDKERNGPLKNATKLGFPVIVKEEFPFQWQLYVAPWSFLTRGSYFRRCLVSVVSGLLSRPSRLLPRSLPRRTFGEERGLLSRTAAGNLYPVPSTPGPVHQTSAVSVLVDTVRHAAIQEYLVSINWKFWLHFTIPGKLLVPHWMKIVPFASNWFVLTFVQSSICRVLFDCFRPRNFFWNGGTTDHQTTDKISNEA